MGEINVLYLQYLVILIVTSSVIVGVFVSLQKGNTALHIASLAGHKEVVRVLVHNGATVNISSQVKTFLCTLLRVML